MSLPCQSGLRPCGKKSNRLWEQGQKRFFMFTKLQSEREMNVFVLTAQLGAHCVAEAGNSQGGQLVLPGELKEEGA